MINQVEMELGGRRLSIESGRVARQADGAVMVRYGDTVILATAVAAKEPQDNKGFFPLTVELREKSYAAGKIPGNFFKREGRPSDTEILSCRLIDRSIRPLFPKGYTNEVQVMASVLSYDQENDADILGVIGASTALCISQIPFFEPVGAVRIGRVNNQMILNPTVAQLDESDMDIVVAATYGYIVMVEGGSNEASEEDMLETLVYAHEEIKKICELQKELFPLCGKEKQASVEIQEDRDLKTAVRELALGRITTANIIADKEERQKAIDDIVEDALEVLAGEFPEKEEEIISVISEIEREHMRRMVIEEGRRVDNRTPDMVRPITCEVGILPRTHGSALFTRGQTQSLAVTTLGTKIDERMVDVLEGKSWKSFMVDYNFPPFSVGEVRPIRGPGRREIGHGALAERALQPLIPKEENFPYTIRIVSDILESNGSSSMATVCAGSLSLMDAGVPIKTSVAGVAMGLIKEGDKYVILTDIAGVEDHLGDMDFKVAGSREGITAFQMDVKIKGINLDIIKESLFQAKQARMHVLEIMEKTLSESRAELSIYAPRIISFKIKTTQIGAVIGTGGKTIREIQEQTGTTINIEDDGTVTIASVDQSGGERALEMIQKIVEEPEVGKIYQGLVKRVMAFGAFIEILPGKEGMVHISELDFRRVNKVEDVVNVGDQVLVKIIDIDPQGKIKLSRKATIERQENSESRKFLASSQDTKRQ